MYNHEDIPGYEYNVLLYKTTHWLDKIYAERILEILFESDKENEKIIRYIPTGMIKRIRNKIVQRTMHIKNGGNPPIENFYYLFCCVASYVCDFGLASEVWVSISPIKFTIKQFFEEVKIFENFENFDGKIKQCVKIIDEEYIYADSVNKCSGINLTNLIEEGGTSVIYMGESGESGKKYAIKYIYFDRYRTGYNLSMRDIYKEIELCLYMGEKGISPKIYDTFFVNLKGSSRVVNESLAVIIMDYYPMSGGDFMEKNIYKPEQIRKVVTKMIDLIKKTIYDNNLYCSDTKPENFVVQEIDNDINVKMIDFGSDWCNNDKKETKDEIFQILVFQLIFMSLYFHKIDCDSLKHIFKFNENIYDLLNSAYGDERYILRIYMKNFDLDKDTNKDVFKKIVNCIHGTKVDSFGVKRINRRSNKRRNKI